LISSSSDIIIIIIISISFSHISMAPTLVGGCAHSVVLMGACGMLPLPGRSHLCAKRKEALRATASVVRRAMPGGDSGVLDRPTMPKFDVTIDNRTKRKKPPNYQVMLHNDNQNLREYVVKVLVKVVTR